MNVLFRLSIFALTFAAAAPSFAWGPLGHRVVGEIAQRHLCASSAKEAAALLDGESLAEASTWADDIRGQSEMRYTLPWHFVSLPPMQNYADSEKNPAGDTVTAIKAQSLVLADRSAPKEDRARALRFLIHFVEDAHQPMHAGHPDDHGGNSVRVTWFNEATNLHQVWDSGILEKFGLSFSELANFLDKPGAITSVPEGTPETWINESARIADAIYEHVQTKTPIGTRDQMNPANLGYRDFDLWAPIAKRRLLWAGARLASALNQIFGCETNGSMKTRSMKGKT